MAKLPDKIVSFNAYAGEVSDKNKLIGVTGEITLPTFEFMSETLDMAGIMGEVDSPAIGQLKSAEMEIPFAQITKKGLKLAADDSKQIILRSPMEMIDEAKHKKTVVGRTITVRGMTKSIDYGKLKKGGYGEPKIKKEILYYKDVLNGETVTEIDKLANVFMIAGTDMMKQIRAYL